MIDELNQAIKDYKSSWQKLVEGRTQRVFFEQVQPTAVAYKAVDLEDFDRCFNELRGHCDQIHFGWVNERWLTCFHLKDESLEWDIRLIKLMQRRPNSKDPVGLDHIDFFVPGLAKVSEVLAQEAGIKWTKEMNGENCKWISVWFEGTEAKLRKDTVLDVCIAEMQQSRDNLNLDK